MANDKKQQINFWYAFLAIGAIFLLQFYLAGQGTVEKLAYSDFLQALKDDKVAEIVVRETTIQGRYRDPMPGSAEFFVTTRVDPLIAPELEKYDVKVSGGTESTFLRDLMSWVIPALVFGLIWIFLIRKLAEKQGFGGLMSVGKSKAKVYVEKDTKVSFDDVAGIDEAKAELAEIVAFLKEPEDYGRLGARIPKGILLVGPPGTGKTLLARAVAGEAGVPFFSISGSEFVEMFVGVGAARVRDLFEQARAAKPCIIFIDELDALGRRRGGGPQMGGHDEKEQTLNQLLAELDGFDPREGIVLLAATNRPEILDPALLRAGRFDRQVLVDRPERLGRRAILEVHVKKIKLDDKVDLDQIAGLTPGFTGADLANLVNEAALAATRRRGEKVTLDDFTTAVERIVAGLEKTSRILNPHERAVVAHHEMGHALVAASLPGVDPVHKVSIIPRGIGALGYTMQRPTEDRFLITTAELRNKMAVLMGGRAAEQLVFSEVSTGAADDLDKASEIARHMVTRYGMSDALGHVVYQPQRNAFLGEGDYSAFEQRSYAEATAREIDLAVRDLVEQAFVTAKDTLAGRRGDLETGAALLLENETLTVEEFPAMAPAKTP
ncbi:Cell division protein FtsH [hydrothermal vent metagenome]|uniref:Cell division protein FtsH n=1 Tax=hydrothermal vent metagenome TaxID=652676 RepID=A0A3B0SZQ2_9ZZZZ